MPCCPSCSSLRIWKDGLRQTGQGRIQRFICRDCGYRFSETTLNGSDIFRPVGRIHREILFNGADIPLDRQICVTQPTGAKNLARQQPETRRAAGATKPTLEDMKGKIVEHLWWLKKQGYAPGTIESRAWMLNRLIKLGANLLDPESVKEVIAKQETWDESTKWLAVEVYLPFTEYFNIPFGEIPRYKQRRKIPFVPTEEEIDQLIAGCGNVSGAQAQLIKETGMRSGEAWRLKWTDIDVKKRTVRVRAEKGSNPRVLSISKKLVTMLSNLPRTSEKIFTCSSPKIMRINFRNRRKRLATKLGNPRLLKITFCSMRHWKGTMEYHRTKDILYVMKILGHKSIQNTLIYIDIEKAIFNAPGDEEFTVRVAKTVEEACELIEAGFEYVTGEYTDGGKIFRKRK